MRQQINLYQLTTRDRTPSVSARSVGIGLGVLAACLAGVTQYGSHRVAALERGVQELRAQQATQQQHLARSTKLLGARDNIATIDARIQQLGAALSERERALQLLQSGAAGQTTGFAPRLEALARRHVPGLWLDSVRLSGTSPSMSLQGATTNPDVVPLYLQSLADDPVLAGTRFDQFVIQRPQLEDPGTRSRPVTSPVDVAPQTTVLRFSAGNTAIPALTPKDGRS